MTTQFSQPVLVRSTDAEVLQSSGVTLFADTPATGGKITTHRSIFRPGAVGAPPHLHKQASELFFILDGALRVLIGDDIITLHAGDFLMVPPNLPHAFEAEGDTDAHVLFVLTDAAPRFDYYRLLEEVYRGDTDPSALAATSDLYDNHYVDSPTWTTR